MLWAGVGNPFVHGRSFTLKFSKVPLCSCAYIQQVLTMLLPLNLYHEYINVGFISLARDDGVMDTIKAQIKPE